MREKQETLTVLYTLSMNSRREDSCEIVGYVVEHMENDRKIGYTCDDTYKLLQKYGASNAIAIELNGWKKIIPDSKSPHPDFSAPSRILPALNFNHLPQTTYSRSLLDLIERKVRLFSPLRTFSHSVSVPATTSEPPDNMREYEQIATWLFTSRTIVCITGEGIAAPNSLTALLSSKKQNCHEDLVQDLHQAYSTENWELFWNLFQSFLERNAPLLPLRTKKTILDYFFRLTPTPTPVHYLLNRLEKQRRTLTIITKNIDNLHETAGSSHVLHLYGDLQAVCTMCGQKTDISSMLLKREYICSSNMTRNSSRLPYYSDSCSGEMKPDIALFTDKLRHIEESKQAIREADLVLIIGLDGQRDDAVTEIINTELRPGSKRIFIGEHEPYNPKNFTLILAGEIQSIVGGIQHFFSKLKSEPIPIIPMQNGRSWLDQCSVCGIDGVERVFSSQSSATKRAYCRNCLADQAIMYKKLVRKLVKRGRLDNISPALQATIMATLQLHDKTKEQLYRDVQERLE